MSESAFPLRQPQAPPALWRLRSDEQLARRAAQGEERAFAEIFRRYGDSLYRFCLAMTGSPHDAQDALQNAMVKALRALPGEQREIKLKPWLYRVARNESIEVMRRRRENEQLDPEQLTGGSAAEAAETREHLRTLLADLELLPERQRAVLLMRELSGLDFADIAAAYDTSPAAARQTLYEARLSLRALEEGRERRCADVCRELSDSDGRAGRRLKVRAHLRSCPECRAFGDAIAERHRDLAALAPLPAGASLALLRGLLGGSGGGGGAGGGALAGTLAPATQTLAVPVGVKSAAAVALIAASVSVAGGTGVIDLSGSGGGAGTAGSQARSPKTEPAQSHRRAAGTDKPSGTHSGSGGARPHGGRTGPAASGDSPGSGDGRTASTPVAGAAPDGSSREPSRPQAGQSPPGGGYGESASGKHGRPEQPPAAAETGSQTAGEHRPERLPAAPGPPPSPSDPGTGPPVERPPAEPPPPPQPASPPSEAPSDAGPPARISRPAASDIRPEN